MVRIIRIRGAQDDSQLTAKRSKDNGIPAADLILVCNDCSTEALSTWDKAFLKSLAEIAERFGANVALSEKQWNHLWLSTGCSEPTNEQPIYRHQRADAGAPHRRV